MNAARCSAWLLSLRTRRKPSSRRPHCPDLRDFALLLPSNRLCRAGPDFFLETNGQTDSSLLQIVLGTQIQPVLRFHREVAPKSECRIRSDCVPALHYFADRALWGADAFGQAVLTDARQCQEFFEKTLSGMNGQGVTLVGHHSVLTGNSRSQRRWRRRCARRRS